MRAAVVALGVFLSPLVAPPAAAADPPIHLHSPSSVVTDAGSKLHLPAGYFLDENAWKKLDVELRRLQEAETRLAAENKSLRASAATTGWKTVSLVVTTVAGGVYAIWRASR